MDERQPPPTRNPSRTLAKIAVAVLVVIAIAGIVLASLAGAQPRSRTRRRSDATQPALRADDRRGGRHRQSQSPQTPPSGRTQVVFAPKSDQLSEPATAKVRGSAETARKQKRTVTIDDQFEAPRPERARLKPGQQRAIAVRSVARDRAACPLGRMDDREVTHLPAGVISPTEANRVEVDMR